MDRLAEGGRLVKERSAGVASLIEPQSTPKFFFFYRQGYAMAATHLNPM